MGIIYKATNKINGKAYIGFTTKWPLRKKVHENKAKRGGEYFHNALAKYGEDNFDWFILLTDATLQDEMRLIEEHGTYYETGNGYNLTRGGEGKLGYKTSEETKKKISEAHKGKVVSDEVISRLRLNAHKMRGVPRSVEDKAKISAGNKGKVRTPEQRKNISENHASKRPSGAYYQSPEYKAKMSKALKGRKKTPEQIEKYRLASIARWQSEEYRAKMSKAKKR